MSDCTSSKQPQILEALGHVLRKSEETTSEVKVLQNQVATLLEVVHTAVNEGCSLQTPTKQHAGSSKWASSARLDLVGEVITLKQHVSTLEIALRNLPAFDKASKDDRNGGDELLVKAAISALESRLEFQMSALQEADANILRRCDECTRNNQDILSILENFQLGLPDKRKSNNAARTPMLVSNVDEMDRGTVGQSNEHDKNDMNSDMRLVRGTTSDIADLTGSARGWSKESEEENTRILQVVDMIGFAIVFTDLAMVGVVSHVEIKNAIEQRSNQEWISFVQLLLALAFTAEISVRFSLQRTKFFTGHGFAWNLFDLLVTIISLLNAVLQLASRAGALGSFSFLRILRLLRLVRAARMLRKMHMLSDCRLLMDCMAHAVMPTFWGFLLLLFTVYIWAAVLVQWLEMDFRGDLSPDANVIHLYGGLGRSMYTVFLAISGGEVWSELAEPLGQRSEWFRLFFILYVSFVTFGMLNVWSAVFVSLVGHFVHQHQEERLHDAHVANASAVEELRQLLNQENTREDGLISLRRVQKILIGNGAELLEKLALDMDQVTGAFRLLDAEDKGIASIDEFMCSLVQLKGNPNSIHVSTLMYENRRILMRLTKISELCQQGFASITA